MFRTTSVPSLSIGGILTTVDEPFTKGFPHLVKVSKVFIVPVPFSRQKRVKAMMKIVVPLGVEAISAFLRKIDDPDIIEIAFGNDRDVTPQSLCLLMDCFSNVIQDMPGAEIE